MSDLKDFVIVKGVLKKYKGTDNEVIIPDGVKRIGKEAFYDCENLTSITLPNGVTSISDKAFQLCTGLTSITIPDSVTSIGDEAFYGCEKLKSITLPDKVKIIGIQTFYGCSALEKIKLPNSLDTIELQAFQGCSSLKEITLPESLQEIEYRSFCSGLSKVIIKCHIKPRADGGNYLREAFSNAADNIIFDLRKNSVTIINEFHRKALSLICFLENIANGIEYDETIVEENLSYIKRQRKKLYEYALKNDILMKYMLDGKIITIEDAMTLSSNMDAVESIEIKAMLMAYVDSFGDNAQEKVVERQEKRIEKELLTDPNSDAGLKLAWNFKKNPDGTITLNSLKQESEVVIVPEKIGEMRVTALNDRCFKGKKNVKKVVIPQCIEKLGSKLFFGCGALEEVIVEAKIEEIESETFNECSAQRIVLPNSVKAIKNGAFNGCEKLENIHFPQGLEYIGRQAFKKCSALKIDYLPENIKELSCDVFSLCKKVKMQTKDSVDYIGTEDNPYHYLYSVARGIEYLNIDDNCKIIATGAFEYCKKIMTLEIGNSISAQCFQYDNTLIAGLVKTAFIVNENNPAYTSRDGVLYDKSVKKLISAPYGVQLEQMIVPEGVEEILPHAFKNCTGVKQVILPNSVTRIGSGTFEVCTGLESLALPEGVQRINDMTFYGCEKLTSIIIPNSVTSIGERAFQDCEQLKNITLPNSLKSIDTCAFSGCESLTNITIPDGVTNIGVSVFTCYVSGYFVPIITIRGKSGSYIEEYAKKNGIKFEAI